MQCGKHIGLIDSRQQSRVTESQLDLGETSGMFQKRRLKAESSLFCSVAGLGRFEA